MREVQQPIFEMHLEIGRTGGSTGAAKVDFTCLRCNNFGRKPSHLRIFSAPPPHPEQMVPHGRISKKVNSNVSFLLDTVPTITLRCIYCQVLSLPPVKIHPQMLERSINISCKFQQNCYTATGKIYLRCPSASPRPISKCISKIACCSSLMVLLEVLLPTAASAMIKTHSAYKSTQQQQCVLYSIQHLSWRAPAHPLNNLHDCYQSTKLSTQSPICTLIITTVSGNVLLPKQRHHIFASEIFIY